MKTDPRIAALAMWLEAEFDPDVYDRRTLAGVTVDGWERLAKSALKFMDRAERDKAYEEAYEEGKPFTFPNPGEMTAEERSRMAKRKNWKHKEAK